MFNCCVVEERSISNISYAQAGDFFRFIMNRDMINTRQLIDISGVAHGTVSQCLSGDNTKYLIQGTVRKIANAFHVSEEFLENFDETQMPKFKPVTTRSISKFLKDYKAASKFTNDDLADIIKISKDLVIEVIKGSQERKMHAGPRAKLVKNLKVAIADMQSYSAPVTDYYPPTPCRYNSVNDYHLKKRFLNASAKTIKGQLMGGTDMMRSHQKAHTLFTQTPWPKVSQRNPFKL